MALTDELRAYLTMHGTKALPTITTPGVVIIGEDHGYPVQTMPRLAVSVQVVRDLLRDARYRYFGNEWFHNAGPIRLGVRDYWQRGKSPPPYDPEKSGLENISHLITHGFKSLLDDLRTQPRYILHIGSRATDGATRDRRIARHFFEETTDRGVPKGTPGVLLLGAAHAAAVPYLKAQPTTTRMILESHSYLCKSIVVLTDYVYGSEISDKIVPLTGASDAIRLTSLVGKDRVSVFTNHRSKDGGPSVFRRIRFQDSDAGHAIAEQFEFIVLQRI